MSFGYIFSSILYFYITNNVYITFGDIYNITEVYFIYKNVFLSGLIYMSILYLLDVLALYLGNKFLKQNKKFNYYELVIYTFLFRFIPILSHLGSYYTGKNKLKFIYKFLFLTFSYIIYLIIGYILVKNNF